MALGQITVNRRFGLAGATEGGAGAKIATGTIVLDSSYPTGGSGPITPLLEAAGLDIVSGIISFVPLQSLGYEFDYLPGSDLLKVWNSTGNALNGPASQVANGTNLSANTLPFLLLYE